MKTVALVIATFLIGCQITSSSKMRSDPVDARVSLPFTAKNVAEKCTNPHQIYGIPPQNIPGIPIMIVRHAECLGHPNILVTIWPGKNSPVNRAYSQMVVEHYIDYLKTQGEHFEAINMLIEQIPPSQENTEAHVVAVYKLKHVVGHQKSDTKIKNSHDK